jgi:hypothetical protein
MAAAGMFRNWPHLLHGNRRTPTSCCPLKGSASAQSAILSTPAEYSGPELPAEIANIVAELQSPVVARPLPTIGDFLANAKTHYGFVPAPTTERDFKRKYAQEALAVGFVALP